jgi:hypothetical protein
MALTSQRFGGSSGSGTGSRRGTGGSVMSSTDRAQARVRAQREKQQKLRAAKSRHRARAGEFYVAPTSLSSKGGTWGRSNSSRCLYTRTLTSFGAGFHRHENDDATHDASGVSMREQRRQRLQQFAQRNGYEADLATRKVREAQRRALRAGVIVEAEAGNLGPTVSATAAAAAAAAAAIGDDIEEEDDEASTPVKIRTVLSNATPSPPMSLLEAVSGGGGGSGKQKKRKKKRQSNFAQSARFRGVDSSKFVLVGNEADEDEAYGF